MEFAGLDVFALLVGLGLGAGVTWWWKSQKGVRRRETAAGGTDEREQSKRGQPRPPDHAAETTSGFVWIEDGILHFWNKGVRTTTDSVAENLRVGRDLAGDASLPLLMDMRDWPGTADITAWGTFTIDMVEAFERIAFLVDPDFSAPMGPFPDAIDQLLVPARVFTDEEEALVFLRRRSNPQH